MKAVILGKAGSVRVKEKNYRPFYGGESLVDILLAKLVKIMERQEIYLSCEQEQYKSVAEKWGINFIHREERYTRITTSNVDVVRNVCKDVPGGEDILWVTPVEPLFDEYAEVLECWRNLDKNKYDSLNVVYPQKRFMLDQNHNPIGFGFGHWHKYSQEIQPLYQLSWSTCVLSRKCIDEVSYMVGSHPYWYESYVGVVDIDTEEDWEFAAALYRRKAEQKLLNGG
jgi:N-acylneuraminate cytidylyltransferase